MKPINDKKDMVAIRAVSHDERGNKRVEKTELNTHNIDTIKYVQKKLIDKGVQRLDRHSIDGIGIGRPQPKQGHGGKFTWEGPRDLAENELEPVPAAMDEGDPNYVDEEAEERILKEQVAGMVAVEVEVEVAKVAENREGVSRVEVDPQLSAQT